MGKITSQSASAATEEVTVDDIQDLQEILNGASRGTIGEMGDPGVVFQIAHDISGLIDQTEELLMGMSMAIDNLHLAVAVHQLEHAALSVRLEVTEDALANLIGNIDYDDALDHATTDLMDAFAASGSAETNADGELAFDERITFSKSDIKPMLREAIVRWVELKMAQ